MVSAGCSCPYDWDGWCKHIVAALLEYLEYPDEEPDVYWDQPSLESALARLSADELRGVLLRLAQRGAAYGSAVQDALPSVKAGEPRKVAAVSKPSVDGKAIRRQVTQTLSSLVRMRSSEAYWLVGRVVEDVRTNVLGLAWSAIEDNDGNTALLVLDNLTQAYLDSWENLDDSDGLASAFFYDLGEAWCEALLTSVLTASEAQAWAKRLQRWADGLDHDYDLGSALYDAEAVAIQVGNHVEENAKLGRGDSLPIAEVIEDEPPSVTLARLNVLERQGRLEEYLRLADTAGQYEARAEMLIRLGRIAEAFEYCRRTVRTAPSALFLARLLAGQGATDEALRLADYGTGLQGQKADLATWLCDLASSLGESSIALNAAVLACRQQPNLDAFREVKRHAGSEWDTIKPQLLNPLLTEKPPLPAGHVQILLHEGLIGEAIAAVEGSRDYRVIEDVAVAAVATHPEWVIGTCVREAETIIKEGRAEWYTTAVRWLAHARQGYETADRKDEWRTYLAQLIVANARKYKLRPMLERLAR